MAQLPIFRFNPLTGELEANEGAFTQSPQESGLDPLQTSLPGLNKSGTPGLGRRPSKTGKLLLVALVGGATGTEGAGNTGTEGATASTTGGQAAGNFSKAFSAAGEAVKGAVSERIQPFVDIAQLAQGESTSTQPQGTAGTKQAGPSPSITPSGSPTPGGSPGLPTGLSREEFGKRVGEPEYTFPRMAIETLAFFGHRRLPTPFAIDQEFREYQKQQLGAEQTERRKQEEFGRERLTHGQAAQMGLVGGPGSGRFYEVEQGNEPTRETLLPEPVQKALSGVLGGQVPRPFGMAREFAEGQGKGRITEAELKEARIEEDRALYLRERAEELIAGRMSPRAAQKQATREIVEQSIFEKTPAVGTPPSRLTQAQTMKTTAEAIQEGEKAEFAGHNELYRAAQNKVNLQTSIQKRDRDPLEIKQIEQQITESEARIANMTAVEKLALAHEALENAKQKTELAKETGERAKSMLEMRAILTDISIMDIEPKQKAKLVEAGINSMLEASGSKSRVEPGGNFEALGQEISGVPDLGLPRQRVRPIPEAKPALRGEAGPPPIPKTGEVRSGYRFKGGDPGDKASWEKVK